MDKQQIIILVGWIMSSIGLILTGIGLIFSGKQLQHSRKAAQGEFLLHLDEMFRYHEKTHRRLRPGGEWSHPESGPEKDDNEAWADVEGYMGLFERVKVLIDNKIIELTTVDRLYGYRITNIIRNNKIRQGKLENQVTKTGWHDFIELAKDLKRYQ